MSVWRFCVGPAAAAALWKPEVAALGLQLWRRKRNRWKRGETLGMVNRIRPAYCLALPCCKRCRNITICSDNVKTSGACPCRLAVIVVLCPRFTWPFVSLCYLPTPVQSPLMCSSFSQWRPLWSFRSSKLKKVDHRILCWECYNQIMQTSSKKTNQVDNDVTALVIAISKEKRSPGLSWLPTCPHYGWWIFLEHVTWWDTSMLPRVAGLCNSVVWHIPIAHSIACCLRMMMPLTLNARNRNTIPAFFAAPSAFSLF